MRHDHDPQLDARPPSHLMGNLRQDVVGTALRNARYLLTTGRQPHTPDYPARYGHTIGLPLQRVYLAAYNAALLYAAGDLTDTQAADMTNAVANAARTEILDALGVIDPGAVSADKDTGQ